MCRDRGTPPKDEIEVTSEMISAGIKAYQEASLVFNTHEMAVVEIFRTMEATRLKDR